MNIELSSPTHLRITWPLFDAAIEAEIRRRLATVPGIEAGYGRMASAPVIQLARLMDLFPKSILRLPGHARGGQTRLALLRFANGDGYQVRL